MPAPRSQYVDRALTGVSVAYRNASYIAEIVAPTLEVDRSTGIYYKFGKENLSIADSLRNGMHGSNEVDYNLSEATYGPLKEHSLKKGLTYEELEQYDEPLKPRQNATAFLTEKLLIEKEVSVSTVLNSTTLTPQYTTLSGTSQWSDYANSDPFLDVANAIDTVVGNGLVRPNIGVMSYSVWSKLKNHPDLIERIKYAGIGKMSLQALADLWDLDQIVVSQASYNTAKEGQTASLSYIWPKMFSVLYTNPDNQLETVTAMRTLRLKGKRAVYNWPCDEPGIGEWVKVMDNYEHKQISNEAAFTIRAAIA